MAHVINDRVQHHKLSSKDERAESSRFCTYCNKRVAQVKYNTGDNRSTIWMKRETSGVRGQEDSK